jgi:hypothetical protein
MRNGLKQIGAWLIKKIADELWRVVIAVLASGSVGIWIGKGLQFFGKQYPVPGWVIWLGGSIVLLAVFTVVCDIVRRREQKHILQEIITRAKTEMAQERRHIP